MHKSSNQAEADRNHPQLPWKATISETFATWKLHPSEEPAKTSESTEVHPGIRYPDPREAFSVISSDLGARSFRVIQGIIYNTPQSMNQDII